MPETILKDVVEAIGGTPCIRLNRVPARHGVRCEVVAKCEFLNPGGSVKDRIAKKMVEDAEAEGRLKPGCTLVEATSGNTGIGLGMVAAVKGYPLVITMSDKMSLEKEVALRAMGADVIRTDKAVPFDHPESLLGVAKRLEKEKGYVLLNQYTNKSNIAAHYEGTAQEIYEQCDGKIDMVVVGAGTGGTVSGISKRLKELIPSVVIVCVDPIGSILADPENSESGMYHVEGIGYEFVPDTCERERIDRWVKCDDKQSFELAIEIHRYEGLLVGGSSGSAMVGVLEAAKDLREDQRCVVLFADSIRNYMTKFVNPDWMIENGFKEGSVSRPSYEALKQELAALKESLAQK